MAGLQYILVTTLLSMAIGCLQFQQIAASKQGSLPAFSLMENPEFFEGDIGITQEKIEEEYGKIWDKENPRQKKAARRDARWPNGIVRFAFNSSVSRGLKNLVYDAITEIEQESCLQFENIYNSTEGDYILFTDQGTGCVSYGIGKVGGSQLITLPHISEYLTCQHHGVILHEILHALGFWHEHTRPDRDRFIKINEEHIIEGLEHNFLKRCECNVNYQGGTYDYYSIMHYSLTAFSIDGTNATLEVINQEQYIRQGSPTIGQQDELSPGDILQLNRMYDCPAPTDRGRLKIFVRNAIDVPYYDDYALSNNYTTALYALVTAQDESEQYVTRYTDNVFNTQSPEWNEYLQFGSSRWRSFEISIREIVSNEPRQNDRVGGYARDYFSCYVDFSTDYTTDYEVICKQTIWVDSNQPTYNGSLMYCTNVTTCVYFDYELTPNGVPCDPNPCYNGGTCEHTFAGYRCTCGSDYRGKQCEEVVERLCEASYVCNNCMDAYNDMCLGGNV